MSENKRWLDARVAIGDLGAYLFCPVQIYAHRVKGLNPYSKDVVLGLAEHKKIELKRVEKLKHPEYSMNRVIREHIWEKEKVELPEEWVKLQGQKLFGRADSIVFDNTGIFVKDTKPIVDRVYLSHMYQAMGYAVALWEQYNGYLEDVPIYAIIEDYEGNERWKELFTPGWHKKVNDLAEVVMMIYKGMFPALNGPENEGEYNEIKCPRCRYFETCISYIWKHNEEQCYSSYEWDTKYEAFLNGEGPDPNEGNRKQILTLLKDNDFIHKQREHHNKINKLKKLWSQELNIHNQSVICYLPPEQREHLSS